ncbi:hypothetical protein TNCV_2138871 [Trichonephila clavipes]|uniref:Uncharacterized protein n=1 Tax=Trichonephila clavipes TaxID=2585209 RepID=A0A8X6VAK9_TRICX|nr:hypothetical protein TNCV_2138871 [Trichonephila clavipes]
MCFTSIAKTVLPYSLPKTRFLGHPKKDDVSFRLWMRSLAKVKREKDEVPRSKQVTYLALLPLRYPASSD